MDGQRRLARPLRLRFFGRGDCPLAYRVAMRASAIATLFLILLHGIVAGGHLDYPGSPWLKLPGRIAGFVGQSAQDIEISGLEQHETDLVLAAIGVRPGGSLIGFDASRARAQLRTLDWVEDATVRREFPNRLVISLSEREAFAIWQKDGNYAVVDRRGIPMSGMSPGSLRGVLVVSGDGANTAAEQLVNQLEAMPDLRSKVTAASLAGKRRWNLYLANGTKIMLPAEGVAEALKRADELGQSHRLLDGGVAELDLRDPASIRVSVAAPQAASPETTASISKN